ncbi:MAG: flagellar biosynthesis protein FlhF [Chloroflexi bacterium]|nr:flagellar biosynthesis protein FlhF [Chloroflexota bacterium]
MRVKRYMMKDMSKAMAHIRADLGPDAVILSSRQMRRDGFFGRLRAPVWEVLAAVDSAQPNQPLLKTLLSAEQPAATQANLPANESALPPQQDSSYTEELRALRQEIRDLQAAVTQLTRRSAVTPVLQLPPLLQEMHQSLLDQRFLPEVATDITLKVAQTLSPQALSDRKAIQTQMVWSLANLLPVKELSHRYDDHPPVMFVVGPTGVGKTTTIAKLAADYALRKNIPVTLATTDTYRVAAIQQLETYGEILGLPVNVVYSPDELRDLAEKQTDNGIILVDTPGRSPFNSAELASLRSFLEPVPNREVFLTLSACTKGADLEQAASRFGPMMPDGLLFTKLDETDAVGPLFNTVCRTGLPLTYVTTGQKVPDDIEIARPDRVARWALKQEQIVDRLAA